MEVAPAAERDLRRLDSRIRSHIINDLLKLAGEPRPYGVEKLEASQSLFRIRVGPGKNYRAIYPIRDSAILVLILRVGDRKDVYRRLR